MAVFTWSDEMSVRVAAMDGQHKVLIGILGRLDEAMRKGEGAKVIGGVLSDLLGYARTHFAQEETLLAAHGYTGLAAQKAEHERFVKKLAVLTEDYRAGNCAMSVSVLNFLVDWLKNHILKADKQYSAHLGSLGVS